MLAGMRFQVEVRGEDEEALLRMAVDGHRSVREQAGYLLHLKIQDELRRQAEQASPALESAVA